MKKERDYYFDNAKLYLIILVVFGHIIRSYINESQFIYALYMFIYSFHMPAFVLISGYFAKSIHKPGYIKKVALKLLLPYIIFQTFYAVYYYLIDDVSTIKLNPFDPEWAMWFLISLFSWQIILFIVKDINALIVLPVSFLIGVTAGYFSFIDGTLSLSRTLVFLPLFLLGYYAQPSHFKYIRDKKYVIFSILVLSAVFLFYYLFKIDFNWLFGSKPYESIEAHAPDMYSGFKRLAVYVIIIVSTTSFLNIVPNRQLKYTYIGSRTMFIYLLHGLFVGIFRARNWNEYFNDHLFSAIIFAILSTIFIVYFFSHRRVKKLTSPIIELKK
ncbi:acyltransferase family protein [Macrococcus armenti]|uniref:Acyltransferase family protein n=1 Tax=Macrococcus armenti TaxID=2875764 RepID=A0ABY3ZWA3_9STAP|nr:acyltransferase family protein [Macrococcus armenti]UOB21197.1 acyltransferase family protein [Macrococcus armenti]